MSFPKPITGKKKGITTTISLAQDFNSQPPEVCDCLIAKQRQGFISNVEGKNFAHNLFYN